MASRPKGYGMTAELAEKKAGKYDPQLAGEALAWIAAIVGSDFPSVGERPDADSVTEVLKNGKHLCNAIQIINPSSKFKINDSKMAFKMMENIGNFLSACEAYGVPKTDLFQTVDLYEGQNIPQVINGIHALGRKTQAKGFGGPKLGPKEAKENKREFTEEQLKEGQQIIGLQMGSNKGASQAGATPYGLGRQIDKTNLNV